MGKYDRFTYILGNLNEFMQYIKEFSPPNPKRIGSEAMLRTVRYHVDLVILPSGRSGDRDLVHACHQLVMKSKQIGGDCTLKYVDERELWGLVEMAAPPTPFEQMRDQAEKEENRWFWASVNLAFAVMAFMLGLVALGGAEMGPLLVREVLKWIGAYLLLSLSLLGVLWMVGRS